MQRIKQKTRFNPFPPVSSKYGAPMGRHGTNPANLQDCKADELCTSHPQGEYDSGGAYWGLGGQEGPVFAVWARGRGVELGVCYVRAHSDLEAKLKIINEESV